MGDEARWMLAQRIADALDVGDLGPSATVTQVDDGTVIEVDLGDSEGVYIITVASVERVD